MIQNRWLTIQKLCLYFREIWSGVQPFSGPYVDYVQSSSLVQFPCGILKGDICHQLTLSTVAPCLFPVVYLKQLHLTKEEYNLFHVRSTPSLNTRRQYLGILTIPEMIEHLSPSDIYHITVSNGQRRSPIEPNREIYRRPESGIYKGKL